MTDISVYFRNEYLKYIEVLRIARFESLVHSDSKVDISGSGMLYSLIAELTIHFTAL